MIIKKGGFDSPLTNTITEYQSAASAKVGAVAELTVPVTAYDTLLAATPVNVMSKWKGT